MSAEDEKMAEDFINSQPELSRNRFRCINPQTDTDTMLTSLTSMDVAIGMRLHFNILAFLAGTPSLGLAYDPKVQALFQDFSLSEFSMPTHALDLDTMKSRILHLIEDRKSVSAYLLKECSKRANRAQSDLTQLVERITTS
jgi:polysaccharide pyruvyl transferase WcaK-like protein